MMLIEAVATGYYVLGILLQSLILDHSVDAYFGCYLIYNLKQFLNKADLSPNCFGFIKCNERATDKMIHCVVLFVLSC